jgi:hypothetical protein
VIIPYMCFFCISRGGATSLTQGRMGLGPTKSCRTIIIIIIIIIIILFLATDRKVGVRFPALQDFLRNSGSETRSTQPREHK